MILLSFSIYLMEFERTCRAGLMRVSATFLIYLVEFKPKKAVFRSMKVSSFLIYLVEFELIEEDGQAVEREVFNLPCGVWT
ncbi:MAG: hypothetical protein GXO39_02080 [Thermotogae bacterium]|nr:hypothetical protein [Thermotogota bacterium]